MKSPNLAHGSAIAIILTSSPVQSQSLQPGTVVSIGDGDTITVQNRSGQKSKIRFACIDAPEMAQTPYGESSRNRLKRIVPVGSAIAFKPQTTDRYGRTVAEVFRGNLNVNLAMVEEGQAVAYRQYLRTCDSERYLTAEESAKSLRLAFWNQSNPIMPWDYRRSARRNQAKTIHIQIIQLETQGTFQEAISLTIGRLGLNKRTLGNEESINPQ